MRGLIAVLLIAGALVLEVTAQIGPCLASMPDGSKCGSGGECIASSASSGCEPVGSGCTTCWFAGQSGQSYAVAVGSVLITRPGHYAEYGLRSGDSLFRLNGSGIDSAEVFTTIDILRRKGPVVLTAMRRARRGYRTVEIRLPKY